MYAPSTYNWACAECGVGSGFIKNGSVIPTADGVSDTCDCPAGYYLDNTGLNCNECPAGQTSAGGACDGVLQRTGIVVHHESVPEGRCVRGVPELY
jgi:hypothetical protein